MNLRLFYKLIAIALLPFFFEGLLAVSLVNMVTSAQNQAMNEKKARRASADLNDLYERTTETAQMVAVMVLKSQAPNPLDFTRHQQTIEGDLKDIREMVADDPDMMKQVDELDRNISASLRVVSEADSDIQSGNHMVATSKLKYLKTTVPVVTAKLKELRNHFEESADEHFYRQKDYHDWITKIVILGLAFNGLMVLGFALVVGIERDIKSRLLVLVENTRRLAKQEPLLPSVGGKDEIAHLETVFKDMAEALDKARLEREEIERLKQEFVAMISHDLRTPLTSIQVFLNMLAKGMLGDVPEKVKSKAEAADRNASRLIGLINDLLDMEKMEAGELTLAKQETSIDLVLERSIESVKDFADKSKVALTATTGSGLQIDADPDRLVQVLVNLLSNAVKFSPEGATVSVSSIDSGECVTVKVIDQGRGVPEHLRASIFERFKQVDSKDATEKKGTGLGLAICKAIVEQHGGTIGVDSRQGQGSTFWFTIPKIHKPAESQAPPATVKA